MKVARIVFIVLGWISIAINIAAFLFRPPNEYYKRIKDEFDNPIKEGLIYYMGTVLFFIIGFLFLLIAFLIKKQRDRMPKENLVDSLLEENITNTI